MTDESHPDDGRIEKSQSRKSNKIEKPDIVANKSQVSRRRFIKASSVALIPASFIKSKSDDVVKIPELRNQEEVVKWLEVPKEWLSHKQKVEEVRNDWGSDITSNEGIEEIGIIAAPERYGGKKGLQIELTVDKSKLESEVPDHVEGVNIQTVERESKYEHLACYNNTFGGGIHGGVACSSNISTIDEVGTTFCKVMDGNDPGILTASHVVSNGDVYGNMDTSLNYQKIGLW